MKILHVISDLDLEGGGPAQACTEMAELMARRGHDMRIITTDSGLTTANRGRGRIALEAFAKNWPHRWGTSWSMRRRLLEAIPEADVVHLHSLYLFHDLVAGRYCWRFAKPYIVRPHGTLDPYIYARHRWRKSVLEVLFQNAVLRRAAGLHYTTVDEWELARPHVMNPRGCVVPNGVDLSKYADLPPPSALRARYPQIGDRKVILFFGRLNFKKGIDITIKVFAEVAKERDDIFLVLAGPDGGLRHMAEKWIAEVQLQHRSLFTGMVSGEDKRIILGGSQVFVLPSHSENFGIAVIEAAACGIPLVVSDRVNLWRDFHDAGAVLVGPPSVVAFADHLRALLNDPVAAAAMARRAADLVRRRFTWESLADKFEDMYRRAALTGVLPIMPASLHDVAASSE